MPGSLALMSEFRFLYDNTMHFWRFQLASFCMVSVTRGQSQTKHRKQEISEIKQTARPVLLFFPALDWIPAAQTAPVSSAGCPP